MASTLTLEEFIHKLKKDIDKFNKQYQNWNAQHGNEYYPMHFSEEHWYDQWEAWNANEGNI